jgi:hypothetical protein
MGRNYLGGVQDRMLRRDAPQVGAAALRNGFSSPSRGREPPDRWTCSSFTKTAPGSFSTKTIEERSYCHPTHTSLVHCPDRSERELPTARGSKESDLPGRT